MYHNRYCPIKFSYLCSAKGKLKAVRRLNMELKHNEII